jgi:phosphoadenosine phosphosulfate reductase
VTVAGRVDAGPAHDLVAWAWERFSGNVALTASFQDCVLIDVAAAVAPDIEVVFCDTGSHFPETLDYVEQVRGRYGLNLRVLRPDVPADAALCGTADCCRRRKVEPLRRHLVGRDAWLSGLRRVETPARATIPEVGWDERFGLLKVCPLAGWTDADVDAYTAARGLPVHPLRRRGYLSIGCAPTTAPVRDGADSRSGRWPGQAKTECGLHR